MIFLERLKLKSSNFAYAYKQWCSPRGSLCVEVEKCWCLDLVPATSVFHWYELLRHHAASCDTLRRKYDATCRNATQPSQRIASDVITFHRNPCMWLGPRCRNSPSPNLYSRPPSTLSSTGHSRLPCINFMNRITPAHSPLNAFIRTHFTLQAAMCRWTKTQNSSYTIRRVGKRKEPLYFCF